MATCRDFQGFPYKPAGAAYREQKFHFYRVSTTGGPWLRREMFVISLNPISMPVDRQILAIDAKIVELRLTIEEAEDKLSPTISATQAEIDKLIEQRYARLLELEKQLTKSSDGKAAP